MEGPRADLSGFDQIDFDIPPIGVKFLFFEPEDMDQLGEDKKLSLCEMLKEVQDTGEPFYFSKENEETCVGKILLGMEDMAPFAESGQIGDRLEVFQEPRANYSLYKHVPTFEKNIINYVAFAPIDKLTFDPDVLVITAEPSKAEIVMRAVTHSTGEMYTSKTTPVMGCAWTLIYPFQTGEVNHLIPQFVHGMHGRELFSEEKVLVSIPFQWIPTVAQNLKDMIIDLPSHESKEAYYEEFEEILCNLAEESKNP